MPNSKPEGKDLSFSTFMKKRKCFNCDSVAATVFHSGFAEVLCVCERESETCGRHVVGIFDMQLTATAAHSGGCNSGCIRFSSQNQHKVNKDSLEIQQ